ncbi:putative P-type Ca(2+) transporter [Helianthus anomalus]
MLPASQSHSGTLCRKDVESGGGSSGGYELVDPFDIARTKGAPVNHLRRWRLGLAHYSLGRISNC